MEKVRAALICLLIMFVLTGPAAALTVSWDQHTDPNVAGYTLYWQEQGAGEEFRVDLPSRAITTYFIEDKYFKIGKTYDLWLTCYNDQENSGKSNVIQFVRKLDFQPPASKMPTVEYEPEAPATVTITASP